MVRTGSGVRRWPHLAALIFVAAILSFALNTHTAAQTTNGAVVGVVTDAQTGVLPGATLTLRNSDTGLTRTVVADADGRFRLGGLPPGTYELRAELQGFGPVSVTGLVLTVGTEVLQNVTMQLQGVQESVSVTAQSPIVETTKVEVSGVITQQQMQMLPLATRQPMDLALLMPGTNQDAVRPRKANSNIGAGAFTNGSALLVDGVWNKEGNTGEPRQDFPQAAIREFKVFVSQAPAEYGWTAGGAVSFATKSGTNLFTGEVFEYFRHKALNAQDAFEVKAGAPEPDFSRHQFGGALGGPVMRDRVHFFVAAERTKNNLYKTVLVQQPQYYGHFNGTFPSPEYNNMVFSRGDVQLTQEQTVFLRYAWQDSDFTCEGCSSSSSQPFFGAGGIQQKRYSLAGAHTWVLSPRVLNEVRGQWTNYHFRQHPAGVRPVEDLFDNSIERTAPLTPVYTFPSLTWGSSGNFYTTQLSRQLRNDMSISTGIHTWKFGAGAQSLSIHGDNRASLGTWTFRTDQPFDPEQLSSFVPLPGSVSQFNSGAILPLPVYNPNVMWDTYIEDEWRVRSNLTLQLGLRYDYQAKVFNQGVDINDKNIFPTTGTPTQLPYVDFDNRGDKDNFAPRLGAAWDVKGTGTSVVRAGFGVYYNPMNIQLKAPELENFRRPTAIINNPTYPDPYGGRDPLAFVSTAPQNISINANDLENLESKAYTVGLSQELTPTLALHVDGVYNKMTKVPMALDINPRSGGAVGVRPLPQFGRILENRSIGWSDYRALLARLEKRFDNRYMFMVSYTLMDTEGIVNNSGGTLSTVTHSENIDLDLGPNANDRRHALVVSGALLLPWDVNLSGVFSGRSTLPFSAQAGIDRNGDGNNTDYVPGTTRNAFNRGNNAETIAHVNAWRALQPPNALNPNGLAPIAESQIQTTEFLSVDLRATKAFVLSGRHRFEVIAQVFNLLNRTNLLPVWTTNSLSNVFGTISSASNMRQAEFAIRYSW
jgi:Carboxypeptidase regulatory-like domain